MDHHAIARTLHPLERKVLPHLLKHSKIEDLVDASGLMEIEVMRALQWMQNKKIVSLTEEIKELRLGVAGGLHALEHAQIATLPLFAMCDRMDLGGVSYTLNPELDEAAIFIYDGHEGGVGLTHRGFDMAGEWFLSTLRLMEECPCEVSCPSCTQDPHCGNANEPLDKRAAIHILKSWLPKRGVR